MKKIFSLVIILIFTVILAFTQTQKTVSTTPKISTKETPKEAVVVINFLDLPGKENAKSKWEVSYELRMIDRKSLIEATVAGKFNQMSTEKEKVGTFIYNGSFTRQNLSEAANRKVFLKIPLDEKIQEKLKNADNSSQDFLFYASALVYDGKLKKNIFIPLSWVWRYESYPNAKFGMDFKITEDKSKDGYSYTTNTFVPDKLSEDSFVITTPKGEKNQ